MKQTNHKLGAAVILAALMLAWAAPLLAATATEQLRAADERYVDLLRDKKLRNDRTNWLELIESYEKVRSKGPSAAAKADFKIGKIYEQLAGFSGREADNREAIKAYKRLAGESPKNSLADEALCRAAKIHESRLDEKKTAVKLYRQVIAEYPEGDQAKSARKALKELGASETEPKAEKPKDKAKTKDAAKDKAAKDKAAKDKSKANETAKPKGPSLDEAERQYIELLKSPALRKERANWLKLVAVYEDLKAENPASSMFKIGKLYEQLGGFSAQESDYRAAVKSYSQLAAEHPKNSLADDSLLRAGRLQELYLNDPEAARQSYQRIVKNYPKGDMLPAARERLSGLKKAPAEQAVAAVKAEARAAAKPEALKPETNPLAVAPEAKPPVRLEAPTQTAKADESSSLKSGQTAKVKSVRAWNNGDYVRVTIELDHKIPFRTFVLPPNEAAAKPYRLVIDLDKATLASAGKAPQETAGMVGKIRFSPQQGKKSRIVLDLREEPSYTAFRLEEPNRIVLDVRTLTQAARTPTIAAAKPPVIAPAPTPELAAPPVKPVTRPSTKSARNGFGRVKSGQLSKMPSDVPSIARQLSLKVSRIVLDPGHGGKDPGAICNGLREEDITLEIAERLAERLRKEGYEVFVTRDRDETVALEERTAFANRKKADLFISLHLNANRDSKARGIESYFLNLTTDETAIEVAARENSTSMRSLGELQGIINDLMLNSKINESSRFAGDLHKGVLSATRATGYNGADRGVRQAPFYVLLGAQMPSVLLELGFVTNEKDAELLQKASYQKTLVDGIWKGINNYINQTGYAFYDGGN